MGLTSQSTGLSALRDASDNNNFSSDDIVIALAGNPNTGKSTVFNSLTGLNQHTGNWTGKTVATAKGNYKYKGKNFVLVDLPGTYSLLSNSVEEEVARDFVCSGNPHATVVVTDATCLERNLNLVLQILEMTDKVVVCVNLMDEAKRKKIRIDLDKLTELLGVPVVGTSARSGKGLVQLMDAIYRVASGKITTNPVKVDYGKSIEAATTDDIVTSIVALAEDICSKAVVFEKENYNEFDRKIDNILTSKVFGIPIMIALLGVVFWITIEGANVPSEMISIFLFWIEAKLTDFFILYSLPSWLHGALVLGMYRTLAWVVSVMLPPMAIFFPLFTLLEDLGYLPRVAFNLDNYFKKACAHGKQALTMCMGFGCNAAGVIGCRIIDSPRERLIAIITNFFVPCNGRFPTLIAITTIFIAGAAGSHLQNVIATLTITAVIVLGVLTTLLVSKILSVTILKGVPSSFTLELPPYRKPQIGRILVRSVFDRTIFVLGRAVAVAAPAGLIIWIFANVNIGDASILNHLADLLQPFANLLGMDGYILMAFILGLPANEIVMPIIIMSYMSTGSLLELNSLDSLRDLLISHGWTWVTAVSVMLFCLMHFPCATTLLTIRKETGSWKWTFVSFLAPTIAGILVCFVFAQTVKLLGLG